MLSMCRWKSAVAQARNVQRRTCLGAGQKRSSAAVGTDLSFALRVLPEPHHRPSPFDNSYQ